MTARARGRAFAGTYVLLMGRGRENAYQGCAELLFGRHRRGRAIGGLRRSELLRTGEGVLTLWARGELPVIEEIQSPVFAGTTVIGCSGERPQKRKWGEAAVRGYVGVCKSWKTARIASTGSSGGGDEDGPLFIAFATFRYPGERRPGFRIIWHGRELETACRMAREEMTHLCQSAPGDALSADDAEGFDPVRILGRLREAAAG